MKLYEYSALELSKLLQNKKTCAVEIVKSFLEQIKNTDGEIGAYLAVCEDSAVKKAVEIDEKIAQGAKFLPLTGIPVAIKDNICTKEIPATSACKMLDGFVSPYNAYVVDILKQNGAIIIGKLNMDEFSAGNTTQTSYFKKTKNPVNTKYVPGGSSGGNAAAVAAKSAVLTLGSDSGGGIRQPASFCGVVGLKPTYGSVSRYGLTASVSSLEQISPLTRTVKDAALLYSVICGQDSRDATSVNSAVCLSGTAQSLDGSFGQPNYLENLTSDIKGVKIGVPIEYLKIADEQICKKVYSAIERYKNLGATIIEINSNINPLAILKAYYIISSAEISSNLSRYDGIKYGYRASQYTSIEDMYTKTRNEGFQNEIKRRIMLGTFVLSAGNYDRYYKRAKLLQRDVIAEYEKTFQNCDVIMTPVTPTTAFKPETYTDSLKLYEQDIFTIPPNMAGLPAISIPLETSENELPIGLQIIGNKFNEQILLNTAYAYGV